MAGTSPAMTVCAASVLLLAVVLVEKSLALHRQMHPVLERGVAIDRELSGMVGNHRAERLDPWPLLLEEIRQHVAVDQLLDAGMADADAHPAIVVADMRGD